MLDFVIAHFPVLDKIDPHVWVGGIERDIIDKAKPMHEPRSAIVPLIIGDAAGVLGRLDLLEQIGMIAFFDPEEIVTTQQFPPMALLSYTTLASGQSAGDLTFIWL